MKDSITLMFHLRRQRRAGKLRVQYCRYGQQEIALYCSFHVLLPELIREKENFAGLEFIELNACSGGCVGGAMNMENPFIAKARLQNLRRYLPVSQNRVNESEEQIPDELFWSASVDYQPIMQLDTDRAEALRKMQRMQQIGGTLPNLDCGSCGAPNCNALAEDIVCGEADESDCVIRMRQQIEDIWRTMGRMVHDGD